MAEVVSSIFRGGNISVAGLFFLFSHSNSVVPILLICRLCMFRGKTPQKGGTYPPLRSFTHVINST